MGEVVVLHRGMLALTVAEEKELAELSHNPENSNYQRYIELLEKKARLDRARNQ